MNRWMNSARGSTSSNFFRYLVDRGLIDPTLVPGSINSTEAIALSPPSAMPENEIKAGRSYRLVCQITLWLIHLQKHLDLGFNMKTKIKMLVKMDFGKV